MASFVRTLRTATLAIALMATTALGFTTIDAATAPAAAQQIVVQGNSRVEADSIRAYFQTAPGEALTQAKIDEGVAALRATGLYRDVRASRQGNRIVVNINEASVINRVVFEGNRKVKSDMLTAEIQSRSRGPLSREIIAADVQRIYDVYRRSGRYDIKVEPKTIEQPNGRSDLIFEITEGKKTGVKTIEFVGNNAYSASRLKDVMSTGETNFMSWYSNKDVYDPDRLNADQEALRRFYLRNGFVDFRVVSAVANFSEADNAFIITITVDEGEQYRFGQLDVVSNMPGLDPAGLRSALRMRSGSIYNVELIDKTLEDITILVSKRGQAFGQVRPRGDRDAANRTVNVTFVVEEGPRVYVERINVIGNTRTKDHVIRREFDIAEGDAYNRVLIDRAERRLKLLNFFKNVRITSEPGSAPDRVIVNVSIEDQSTGEFSIGGGYSTAEGFIAEASVTERNFMGRGQYVRIGGMLGQRTSGVDFSFTEPYFMDYRLSAGFDLYHRTVRQSTYQSFESRTTGGAVRLGVPLTENLSITGRYSAYAQYIGLDQWYKNCVNNYAEPSANPDYQGPPIASCANDPGEASVALRQLDGTTRFISMVGYSLIYNTLDNSNLPTAGIYAEFKQDFAGVGGDAKWIKTEANVRGYYEVMPEWIAMVKLQGGNMINLNGGPMAAVDQFFKGPELVRGFAIAGIGPRDASVGKLVPDAIGGMNYWGASIELTYPLAFIPKDFGMRGAIFADAGSVWGYDSIRTLGPLGVNVVSEAHIIRSSVGVGLLWNSPFGPIRFDYAWVLSQATNDSIQNFRFSGGTRF